MTARLHRLEWPEEPAGHHVESTPCDASSRSALGPSSSLDGPEDPGSTRAERFHSLKARLGSARDLLRDRPADRQETAAPFPTALAPLDRLLDGGLARGELVEVVGRRSSGRFSALLATLAATTRAGDVAALVDLGDGLAPGDALEAGVLLERLLWLRPTALRQALASAEMLLQGGFPLVVVDLGTPPVPGGRGATAAWLRLGRAARRHGGALLVSSPYRVSGAAAATVVTTTGSRGRWLGRAPGGAGEGPPLLGGSESVLALEKSRHGRHGHSTRLLLATAEALAQHAAAEAAAGGTPAPARAPARAAGGLGPRDGLRLAAAGG